MALRRRQSVFDQYNTTVETMLENDNAFTRLVKGAEEKTGLSRITLVTVGIIFSILYLILGYGARFLATLVGFILPAYRSCKAIETEDKEDDTYWLMYWVVFASINLIEVLLLRIFEIFPGYALLKCLILLWCMTPGRYNGSQIIYYSLIFPLFQRHQTTIDEALNQFGAIASDVGTEIQAQANANIHEAGANLVKRAISDEIMMRGCQESSKPNISSLSTEVESY